jgi:hypothetical protein
MQCPGGPWMHAGSLDDGADAIDGTRCHIPWVVGAGRGSRTDARA